MKAPEPIKHQFKTSLFDFGLKDKNSTELSRKNPIKAHVNLLKLLALIFMTIDHIGLFLFPKEVIWRVVGRLAMPIFVYLVARSVRHSRVSAYVWRLLIFAILAQIMLYFLLNRSMLNILFNFVLLVLFLVLPLWAKPAILSFYLFCEIEYGWLVLALGVVFYYVKSRFLLLCSSFLVILLGSVLLYLQSFGQNWLTLLQPLSFLAIPLILLVRSSESKLQKCLFLTKKWPRYLFYVYYLAHQATLVFLMKILM